jgi:tetratricopeptide (TPR) repeat protein
MLNRQIDGSCAAIFELQDQIAAVVKEKLGQFSGDASRRNSRVPEFSAYECYMKGRQALLHTDKGRLDRAEEWFDRAISIEPQYASALSGQASLHALRYTFTTDSALLDTAYEFASRAIESDPDLSDPHVWLGYIHFHRGNLSAARQEEQAAIRLDAKSVWAHYFSGFFAYLDLDASRNVVAESSDAATKQAVHRQRRAQGLQYLQQAIQLDDKHGWAWLGAGALHMELEQYVEARWCFEQGIELESTPHRMAAGTEGCLAECMRRVGYHDRARECCLRGIQALDNTDNIYRDTFRAAFLCILGEIATAQGDADAARAAFRQTVLHCEGRIRARSIGHAFVQALCGLSRLDSDDQWFQKAWSLYRTRTAANFDPFWLCTEDVTLLALARAAADIGELDMARKLQADAVDSGSNEAAQLCIS